MLSCARIHEVPVLNVFKIRLVLLRKQMPRVNEDHFFSPEAPLRRDDLRDVPAVSLNFAVGRGRAVSAASGFYNSRGLPGSCGAFRRLFLILLHLRGGNLRCRTSSAVSRTNEPSGRAALYADSYNDHRGRKYQFGPDEFLVVNTSPSEIDHPLLSLSNTDAQFSSLSMILILWGHAPSHCPQAMQSDALPLPDVALS